MTSLAHIYCDNGTNYRFFGLAVVNGMPALQDRLKVGKGPVLRIGLL